MRCAHRPHRTSCSRTPRSTRVTWQYGNTVDRWYHRGAVVVWPAGAGFAVRAEASPSWALDDLIARIRRGESEGARGAAATLAPFWQRRVDLVQGRGLFTKALRVARLLDDASTAAQILHPFRIEILGPTHANTLSSLLDVYGPTWTQALIGSWSGQRWGHRDPRLVDRRTWMASLPTICTALDGRGESGRSAARLLLRDSWGWVAQATERALASPSARLRDAGLDELAQPFAALFECASLVTAPDLVDHMTGFLCRDDPDGTDGAVAVLRAVPVDAWSSRGLDGVVRHCRSVLEQRVGRPVRSPDNSVSGTGPDLHLPAVRSPAGLRLGSVPEGPGMADRQGPAPPCAPSHRRGGPAGPPPDATTGLALCTRPHEDAGALRAREVARRRDERNLRWITASAPAGGQSASTRRSAPSRPRRRV